MLPLSVPVVEGFEATTRILYPVPPTVEDGIVAEIVPGLAPFSVPMLVGLPKLPEELLNCAVKTLPLLYVPVIVNETETAPPAQYERGLIALVVIVFAITTCGLLKLRRRTNR